MKITFGYISKQDYPKMLYSQISEKYGIHFEGLFFYWTWRFLHLSKSRHYCGILDLSSLWTKMFAIFSGGASGKESTSNAGDTGSTPRLERSLGEGNDNPVQYSCLENSMDRGVWWATVHGATKSWTRLSTHTYIYYLISLSFQYETSVNIIVACLECNILGKRILRWRQVFRSIC